MTELGFTPRRCDSKPWTQLTYNIADFLDNSKVSSKVEVLKTALLPLAVLPAMLHLQGLFHSSHTLKGPWNCSALCYVLWQSMFVEIDSGLPQLQSDNFLKALRSCQMWTGYHIPGQYVGFSSICYSVTNQSISLCSSCFIPQLFDRLSSWMHLF